MANAYEFPIQVNYKNTQGVHGVSLTLVTGGYDSKKLLASN
jgi:hypothetical protein